MGIMNGIINGRIDGDIYIYTYMYIYMYVYVYLYVCICACVLAWYIYHDMYVFDVPASLQQKGDPPIEPRLQDAATLLTCRSGQGIHVGCLPLLGVTAKIRGIHGI